MTNHEGFGADAAADERFRAEVRGWLEANLVGDFAALRGKGGPGREHESFQARLEWDRHLAAHGWTCLGWPARFGGRELPLSQRVIFHEEYARADAPARVSHIGEELLGPTLIAFGTPAQQQRFLPRIKDVTELWCQGYSEPDAGSDLAAVATRGRLVPALSGSGQQWELHGQKVWTSLAHLSDWCFVVTRTEEGSTRHRGLSYLLVPMHQEGLTVRPIVQLTGTSEFNEVFFDGARTDADLVVGDPGDGWRVAMATLGYERGVSTIGQQVGFARELAGVVAMARANGALGDPMLRDALVRAHIGLDVMRANALRNLAHEQTPAVASVAKLVWATWHRGLGELAMRAAGARSLVMDPDAGIEPDLEAAAQVGAYPLDQWQRLFLFTRADTIYGGSNEIQRNVLAERVLGLPREPVPTAMPAQS